jgi:hypothetical protein
MKKLLLILMVSFCTISVSLAQIIAIEPFDYENLKGSGINGVADGGIGWSGPWVVFEGAAAGFNIDDEGALPKGIEFITTGYRLKGECLKGTGYRAYRPLATPIKDDGSTIWISYLLESENAISGSWQGVSFWNPAGDGEQTLFGKNWGSTFYGAVLKGTGVDSKIPVESNVPVWLVVKIIFSGDASEEQCFLWVNPNPSTEPLQEKANATMFGLLNNGATHIACHFGNTAGIITYFDELMLAKTFNEVVPKEFVGFINKEMTSKISTCYPNPFNASITIDYNLTRSELVSLDIYNVMGEKIETLVEGKQCPGNYKIKWNTTNQSTGIYYYKLKVGDVTEVRKIISM